MTCTQCQHGIQASLDQLLATATIDYIVEWLQGDGLCATSEDERCPGAVDAVIRQGLPVLGKHISHSDMHDQCDAAVPGTCHKPQVWAKLI